MIRGGALLALPLILECLLTWTSDFRAWFKRTTYDRAADQRKTRIAHNITHFAIKQRSLLVLRPKHALRLRTALNEARWRYAFWANPVEGFCYQPTQLAYRHFSKRGMRTVWLPNL